MKVLPVIVVATFLLFGPSAWCEDGGSGDRGSHVEQGAHPHLDGQPGDEDRFRERVTPKRKEILEKNLRRWKNLSLEERTEIRERYKRYQRLSPEQRERIRRRVEIMKSLPPEQQETLRKVFREWKELPPEQRKEMRRGWRNAGTLSPEQRLNRLKTLPLYNRMEDNERTVLREFLERASRETGTAGRRESSRPGTGQEPSPTK